MIHITSYRIFESREEITEKLLSFKEEILEILSYLSDDDYKISINIVTNYSPEIPILLVDIRKSSTLASKFPFKIGDIKNDLSSLKNISDRLNIFSCYIVPVSYHGNAKTGFENGQAGYFDQLMKLKNSTMVSSVCIKLCLK